jgi:hypothetical protein
MRIEKKWKESLQQWGQWATICNSSRKLTWALKLFGKLVVNLW